MATSKKRKPNSKAAKKRQPIAQTLPVTATAEEPEEGLKRDLLDDFMFSAADYIYRRRKLFISLAVALVAIAVAGYGTYSYIQYKINQRNEQLFAIEQVVQNKTGNADQRFDKAIPMLNEFIENYPDTSQQHLALFYRSRLYFDQNKYKEAESDLKGLLAMLEKESDLFVLASLYLSNVLVDQQKNDEAIDILENARTENMTDIILMALAEIYMDTLQADKAKQTLEILTRDYPNSLYAQRAKQLLSLL